MCFLDNIAKLFTTVSVEYLRITKNISQVLETVKVNDATILSFSVNGLTRIKM